MTMFEVSNVLSTSLYLELDISAEIVTGKVPLGHIAYVDFIPLVVYLNVRPERPDDDQPFKIPDPLWTLMESCWEKAPQSRPTALTVCDAIKTIVPLHTTRSDTLPGRKTAGRQILSVIVPD